MVLSADILGFFPLPDPNRGTVFRAYALGCVDDYVVFLVIVNPLGHGLRWVVLKVLNALFPRFFSGSRRRSASYEIKSGLTVLFYLWRGFLRWSEQVENVLYVSCQV